MGVCRTGHIHERNRASLVGVKAANRLGGLPEDQSFVKCHCQMENLCRRLVVNCEAVVW